MAMHVVPKFWEYSGEPMTIPTEDHTLIIECEAVAPPSRVGQKVYVFLDVEAVTKLIPELRKSAIKARQ